MKHVVAVAACNKQGRIFCTNLRSTFNFCFFFYHLSMGWGGGGLWKILMKVLTCELRSDCPQQLTSTECPSFMFGASSSATSVLHYVDRKQDGEHAERYTFCSKSTKSTTEGNVPALKCGDVLKSLVLVAKLRRVASKTAVQQLCPSGVETILF